MSARSLLTSLALVMAAGLPLPAMAGQRSFVASYGNDANVCSLPFPCRTFDVAIAKTAAGGEVIVLDSAGYGTATISQPMSIIAPPGVYAGVSVLSNDGIGFVVDPGSGTVTLRGLTLNGHGRRTIGIAYRSGDALYIDNVVVANLDNGVYANVGVNASLHVTSSTFRDIAQNGAQLGATAGTLTFSIDHTLFAGNSYGVQLIGDNTVGTIRSSTISGGNTGLNTSSKVEIRDCVIADNADVGVRNIGVASTMVSLVSSLISGNATGIQGSVYVSDSTITRNGTGLDNGGGGTAISGLDNRLINNTTNGTFTSSVPKQ